MQKYCGAAKYEEKYKCDALILIEIAVFNVMREHCNSGQNDGDQCGKIDRVGFLARC